MKYTAVSLLMLFAVCARAEFHEFKTPDGKSVKAEITDFKQGMVELQRENGKRVKVKASIFIEADQQYIEEWSALQNFLSDRLLKIECRENNVENWKKEEWDDVRYEDGSTERELLKVTKHERIAYDVTLQNRGLDALEGMRIEYVIYYEQSEESWEKPTAEQKTVFKKADIPALPGRASHLVTTDSIVIYVDSINQQNWVSGKVRTGGKGQINGIRGRLYIKTDSGKEVMREFCSPSALSEQQFPWKG